MDHQAPHGTQRSNALVLLGTPISTFVRKVQLVLAHKRLAYTVRMPPKAELLALNPLGKVPVLQADGEVIIDSSVICDYLERRYPERPAYPSAIQARARALWVEEYADTALQDAFFPWINETLFKPKFYGQPSDPAVIAEAAVAAGTALDYLETLLQGTHFVGGEPTIADFTAMAVLGNPVSAGFSLVRARWPRLAAFVPRMRAAEPFTTVWQPYETVFAAAAAGKHLRSTTPPA